MVIRGGSSRQAAGLQPSLKNVRQKIPPNGETRLKFGFSYEISLHDHFRYFRHHFGSTFPRNPTKPVFRSFPTTPLTRWRFQHTCRWIWQFRGCLRHSPKGKKPSNWLFNDEFLKKKRRKYDLDCFLLPDFIGYWILYLSITMLLLVLWRYWRHWIQFWSPIPGCENTTLRLSAVCTSAACNSRLSWWAV